MVLLIDNYDSFSYNLVQLTGTIYDGEIKVVRNDEIKPEDIAKMGAEGIIISPGPGKPSDAGICEEVIKQYYDKLPILGVCLGHQAICESFGGRIGYAKKLMHGKSSNINVDTSTALYRGVKPVKEGPFDGSIQGARYHSLALEPDTLPDCLKITGMTEDKEIMSVEHREYPVFGLQFHPESILTPQGELLLKNFFLTFLK